MSSTELLVLIILATASAALSASEVALFSLSRFQLRSLKDSVPTAYQRARRLLSDPPGVLLTILVLNESLNVGFSVLTTSIIGRIEWFESSPTLQTIAGILIVTPVILFFCEISPKVTAARLNLLVLAVTLRGINLAYSVMSPIRQILKLVVRSLTRSRTKSQELATRTTDLNQERAIRESDILMMAEKAFSEGTVDPSELELLKKIFELDDTPASEILRPLSQLICIPKQTSTQEALRLLQARKAFRAPVYDGIRTNVVGVLYAKDLIQARLQEDRTKQVVSEVMRDVSFTDPDTPLERIFRMMSRGKKHIAIVRDPKSGHALGVVTMDDVLYELFDHALGSDSGSEVST